MKIEMTQELNEVITDIINDVFKEKEKELNKGEIINVLQEVGATGSRIFIKRALEILQLADVIEFPNDILKLLKQL